MKAVAGISTLVLSVALSLGGGNASAQTAEALVPAAVKAKGVLTVGSQQTFPPVEFREPGKQMVTGASADLLEEVAKRLKLKLEYVQAEYSALIPGIEANRFAVASGGISDTEEREKTLDFVNYMRSGGAMLALAATASQYKAIDDFCGKSVATLLGSRVIMEKVEAASAACAAAGKPAIRAEQLPSAPDARMQLDLKRVDAYLGDLPALAYLGSQFPGKYGIVGGNYIMTPYITSWGFSKKETGLRDAVKVALDEMLADGSYRKIMTKWGLEGGLLDKITINLPASKR